MIHVLVQGGADINGIHAWALTPLDFSNRYGGRLRDSLHSVIAALRFRGGKCRSACRAGDIHLAAVSFSPAVVTVTTSGRAVAGNLYTVQAARGLALCSIIGWSQPPPPDYRHLVWYPLMSTVPYCP